MSEFATDIRHFNPGFTDDMAGHADDCFLVLRGAETVGLVLVRDVGAATARIELDYVIPRYQGFTLGEFAYRPGGPLATRGYRRAVAPRGMQHIGDYLANVGVRRENKDMVRELN